jgi:hypothetical protein
VARKIPSLVTAVSAKHRSKFAALSPVMHIGDSRQIAEKLLVRLKTKQTNTFFSLIFNNSEDKPLLLE